MSCRIPGIVCRRRTGIRSALRGLRGPFIDTRRTVFRLLLPLTCPPASILYCVNNITSNQYNKVAYISTATYLYTHRVPQLSDFAPLKKD